MKTILVTGGCGFIASNFIHRLLGTGRYFVVNVDKMNYCANEKNITRNYNLETHTLEEVNLQNYRFHKADINDSVAILALLRRYEVQIVYHFAAQTHVDQSFGNSLQFVVDNVLGTANLLECCREYGGIELFIHVSTDEVYGDVTLDREDVILQHGLLSPTNPYSATKASAELMVKSYHRSYRIPTIITRSNNVYGPRQYWEKIIPKFIYNVSKQRKCPVYGDGSALRKYLYVDDACEAYLLILEKGVIGETYEMNSGEELSALETTHRIITHVAPDSDPDNWIDYVEDRKFHDTRYVVNPKTLRDLGWAPKITFDDGLRRTVEWYVEYAIPQGHWPYDDAETANQKF